MQSIRKSKKVTVRFPKRLKTEMQVSLVGSGLGLHGKSKWLKTVIALFLTNPNFMDYVENGVHINQADLTEVEAFYLDAEAIELLKDAYITVRKSYPLFEGIQSALIRAAVVYHLMLPKNFPGKKNPQAIDFNIK